MVWLVSQIVCFVVARLDDGKVTSCHVNNSSKARMKILRIFQKKGFSFFFLIMPRYWSDKIFLTVLPRLNHPKAGKQEIKFHETCIVLVELKCGQAVHIFIVT